MRLLTLIVAFALSSSVSHAQMMVENNGDPAALVANLVFTNNLEIFNIEFVGDTNQFGLFNAQNSNIPINYGVVLGTGDVANVIGPNNNTSSTLGGGNYGVSDEDIEALVSSPCNDAAVLEFDFISPTETSITIEFVFGSEEYNNYVCSSYTDGLGIFLSGPGIEGSFSNNAINLATVPGTGSPVSINTINSGVPGINGGNGDNCYAADSLWMENAVYFYNNEIIACPGETQLDGFTLTLSNTAMLVPGETYHIKIVIADASDTALDSAVFLKGNPIGGCTDESALNFNPLAAEENGTCEFAPALCEEEDAVNFGYEGTCCFSESAFNLPALMGTWRLSPDYGGILVGPEPLNGDWYTGQAFGPQLDDQWTFFANGALIFETNGWVMDPMNGYNDSPLNFPLLGYSFEAGAGEFGAGTLTLLNPIGQTCAFMGTWDSGPVYDVLQLGPDTLRLVSPIMDIPTCEVRLVDPGYFSFTFVRTDFDSEVTGVCLWGCTNQSSPNWDPYAQFDNGNCIQTGCTYPAALNYNPLATVDNGFCQFAGCTDETACNFNPLANVDNGSCEACVQGSECPGDLDGDALVAVTDLLILLGAFGNECEPAWTCGDPVIYHGYDYATVLIGDQCWFAENLRTEHYTNGDLIPANLTDSEWSSTTSGAVAVYGEGAACDTWSPDGDDGDACDPAWSLNEYGRLYNWFAVDDDRGLCPTGWHVPTDGEWMTLEMELGMSESQANSIGWRGTDQGSQMKITYGWNGNGSGTNSSGFSGLPGGYRNVNGPSYLGGNQGYWWSATQGDLSGWYRNLIFNATNVARQYAVFQQSGLSVRCLEDAE